jgi:hypothetical protein
MLHVAEPAHGTESSRGFIQRVRDPAKHHLAVAPAFDLSRVVGNPAVQVLDRRPERSVCFDPGRSAWGPQPRTGGGPGWFFEMSERALNCRLQADPVSQASRIARPTRRGPGGDRGCGACSWQRWRARRTDRRSPGEALPPSITHSRAPAARPQSIRSRAATHDLFIELPSGCRLLCPQSKPRATSTTRSRK